MGHLAQQFEETTHEEIDTLGKFQAWTKVKRRLDMNVIKSTWAFKVKRFPNGLIRKFKARFCVRGDMQIEGVDFDESFAPVVNWITVRTLLSQLLNLSTAHIDYTAPFLQAESNEDAFGEMPKGFKGEGFMLKL